MSTEKMREDFEAWKGYPLPLLNSDGQYDKEWLQREWRAWQASRASIEIELPPIWEQGANSALGQACAHIRTADIKAIESLGLKVRPC